MTEIESHNSYHTTKSHEQTFAFHSETVGFLVCLLTIKG